MRERTQFILTLSLIPQFILVKVLARFPHLVEDFYSNNAYLWISRSMRYVFGWVPFSIGDIVYTGIGILAIRWFWKRRSRLLKKPKSVLLEVGATMALVYGFFHLLWGFNYYREPLHERLNIGKDYSTESLIAVTEHLILKANFWHDSLSINDTSKVVVPYSRRELLNRSKSGPNTLSRIIPELAMEPLSIKASIYSLPLTVMGFSGYLNPFTGEAQVDYLIPKHRYPTTLLHEMGHQMGYAAENETNFIGCMAAIYHEDAYFKYSGYIYALRHCLNELSVRDPQAFEQLAGTVNKGIFANYKEVYDFWRSYQNPLEPVFKSVFDTYLKVNNQEQGIASYNYAVALFVNYMIEDVK